MELSASRTASRLASSRSALLAHDAVQLEPSARSSSAR